MPSPHGDGVVLVGGGLAAVAAARSLRRAGHEGPVTLVTDEDSDPYDRPPLSKQYLAGEVAADELRLFRPGEIADLGLRVLRGRRAVALDARNRLVVLDDQAELSYAALLVATGAEARRLPGARALGSVHYLRSRDDAADLAVSLGRSSRLVVIGAGFIGLEVAATARTRGLDVTVLEAAPAALTRVLGAQGGELVTRLHRDRGVVCHFGVRDIRLLGTSRVDSVEFRTSTGYVTLPADVVVVGIGAVPRGDWLADSAVSVDDGIVCDSAGRTTVPDVYAAGDVSRWRNERTGTAVRVEQWQTALEQGTLAGTTIAADLGVPDARARAWSSVPYFWSDQYEHKLQLCGTHGPITDTRRTSRGWVTCYAASAHGPVTGVLAIDEPSALTRGRRLVADRTPWPDVKSWLSDW